jgi:hypothetical protein
MLSAMATAVYIESGAKRVFACALDWPGWCRSARTEEQALAALASYAPRYAVVAREADIRFPVTNRSPGFEVVERLRGTATTDFGAPDREAAHDRDPLALKEADRLAALLAACWTVFDRVAAAAPPALRKGPRGGGRDRDAIVEHVITAEAAYARKQGIRRPPPAPGDATAVRAMRDAILEALRSAAGSPAVPERGWSARYAARREAWHVLDHAWEIEDRSGG